MCWLVDAGLMGGSAGYVLSGVALYICVVVVSIVSILVWIVLYVAHPTCNRYALIVRPEQPLLVSNRLDLPSINRPFAKLTGMGVVIVLECLSHIFCQVYRVHLHASKGFLSRLFSTRNVCT